MNNTRSRTADDELLRRLKEGFAEKISQRRAACTHVRETLGIMSCLSDSITVDLNNARQTFIFHERSPDLSSCMDIS